MTDATETQDYSHLPRTKKDARRRGSSLYYTGKPCARGHDAPRRVTGHCVQCYQEDNNRRNTREEREADVRQRNEMLTRHAQEKIARILADLEEQAGTPVAMVDVDEIHTTGNSQPYRARRVVITLQRPVGMFWTA